MAWRALSFADRLSFALFLLTILAVILAAWSLRVAQQTLDDAKEAGKQQQAQFDQQMQSAAQQFYQQADQSKKQFDQQTKQSADQFRQQTGKFDQQIKSSNESLRALIGARTELQHQAALLETMQGTAKSQLDALSRQNNTLIAMSDVRPLPLLEIACDRTLVFRKDSREVTFDDKSSSLGGPSFEHPPLVRPLQDETGGHYGATCVSHLSAEGRTALTGATLEILSHGDALLFSEDESRPTRKITLLSNEAIAPRVGAGVREAWFHLSVPKSAPSFQLEVIFSSENGGKLDELFWLRVSP